MAERRLSSGPSVRDGGGKPPLSQCKHGLLLDPLSHSSFGLGRRYPYNGGEAIQSPVQILVPHTGRWHVVVIPPPGATVRYSKNVVR